MGKQRHSSSKMWVSQKERVAIGEGKGAGNSAAELEKLARTRIRFDVCSLSLQEWQDPCCTRKGFVFDMMNILSYIRKFKRDPVTGNCLKASDIIALHFHKNTEGKYSCPITHTVFSEHTNIVAIAVSGNVFSREAIEELNVKPKHWKCPISNQSFTRDDIITLQDPYDPKDVSTFDSVKRGFIFRRSEALLEEDQLQKKEETSNIRLTDATRRILEEYDFKAAEMDRRTEKKKKQRLEQERELDRRETAEAVTELRRAMAAGGSSETAIGIDEGRLVTGFAKKREEERRAKDAEAPGLTSTSFVDNESARKRLSSGFFPKRVAESGFVRLHTSAGNLNVELYCKLVPLATENFLGLARSGYYNKTVFHRLIRGFMIQGGDPTGTGRGGESIWKKKFPDEFSPALTHKGAGVLSMANSGPDTNGSQFFITFKSTSHLNGKHTVFGRVVGGKDTLQTLESMATDDRNHPLKPITLESITIYVDPFQKIKDSARAEDFQAISKDQHSQNSTHTATGRTEFITFPDRRPPKRKVLVAAEEVVEEIVDSPPPSAFVSKKKQKLDL